MRTYKQLTQEQRYQIYALMKMGHQQTEIANCIGVDKSTISRELSRNRGQRGYRPKQAHSLAMSAAQERGLIVGKDDSITGFDDIPMSEYSHPALTTIRQPIYKIGARVCDMLIKVILGQELDQRSVILRPELIVRQSTGAAHPRTISANLHVEGGESQKIIA